MPLSTQHAGCGTRLDASVARENRSDPLPFRCQGSATSVRVAATALAGKASSTRNRLMLVPMPSAGAGSLWRAGRGGRGGPPGSLWGCDSSGTFGRFKVVLLTIDGVNATRAAVLWPNSVELGATLTCKLFGWFGERLPAQSRHSALCKPRSSSGQSLSLDVRPESSGKGRLLQRTDWCEALKATRCKPDVDAGAFAKATPLRSQADHVSLARPHGGGTGRLHRENFQVADGNHLA